ncbi:MAG: hypothetical protein LBK77_08730 [Spirochaetaceae bacterium]|nr:hypothetical protein [Spirochaetaceae bacterium]
MYSFCSLFVIPDLDAAEKTLILGASSGWNAVEKRTQVGEFAAVRPHKVLALSSAWTASPSGGGARAGTPDTNEDILALYAAYRNFPAREAALDLAASFDENRPEHFSDAAGRYRVQVSPLVQAANERWARYGSGAALFAGRDSTVSFIPGRSSLFAPGRNVRDFTMEFWLYPNTVENGGQICRFSAADNQRIICESSKNRLRWTFQNFFSPPGNGQGLTITVESKTALIPRTWTHHLVRYNADTGLLEYLINGRVENTAYTTGSGKEGGDVYTPRLNRDGSFILGGRFSGMIDEFRIYNRVIEAPGRRALEQQSPAGLELPELAKFPRGGGRIETRTLDLGETGSAVLRIEASGGRLTPAGAGPGAVKNVYAGRGDFRFPDNSALQFFIRAGEEPYRFNQIPWVPVVPGAEIPAVVQGRYIQLAAAFYPSADCETSPYLEEVRIVYDSNEAPYPPSLVIARALDGGVELSWRSSPDADTRGYLVYYGTSPGVYYGEGAAPGPSPINAGNRNSLRIDGLRNGTLYFFAVSAYDGPGSGDPHQGKFSKEVSARPLRTNP